VSFVRGISSILPLFVVVRVGSWKRLIHAIVVMRDRTILDKFSAIAHNKAMIVTIEVIHEGAFALLSDMERLDLIHINTCTKNTALGVKLSKQFAGALHLSDTGYETYQNTLHESRNGWTRDIC
jgi:hypothetical protein